MILTRSAKKVLDCLVSVLPAVRPGRSEPFKAYCEFHSALGLPGIQYKLVNQGSGDQANALHETGGKIMLKIKELYQMTFGFKESNSRPSGICSQNDKLFFWRITRHMAIKAKSNLRRRRLCLWFDVGQFLTSLIQFSLVRKLFIFNVVFWNQIAPVTHA